MKVKEVAYFLHCDPSGKMILRCGTCGELAEPVAPDNFIWCRNGHGPLRLTETDMRETASKPPRLELVHQDARGEIYRVLLPTDQELMLFFCKAGYLRGGHSHDVPEVVMLLSGRMVYHKMVDGRHEVFELGPGEVSYHEAGVPHMGEFTEDTFLIDWKPGTKIGEFETTDYEPFRSEVRERNR